MNGTSGLTPSANRFVQGGVTHIRAGSWPVVSGAAHGAGAPLNRAVRAPNLAVHPRLGVASPHRTRFRPADETQGHGRGPVPGRAGIDKLIHRKCVVMRLVPQREKSIRNFRPKPC